MFLLVENNSKRQLWTLVLSKIYASTLYCGATTEVLTAFNLEMLTRRDFSADLAISVVNDAGRDVHELIAGLLTVALLGKHCEG